MDCAIKRINYTHRRMGDTSSTSLNEINDHKLPSFSTLMLSFANDRDKETSNVLNNDDVSLSNPSNHRRSMSSISSIPYSQSPFTSNAPFFDSIYFSGTSPLRYSAKKTANKELKLSSYQGKTPIDYKFPAAPHSRTLSHFNFPGILLPPNSQNETFNAGVGYLVGTESFTPLLSPNKVNSYNRHLTSPPSAVYDSNEGIHGLYDQLSNNLEGISKFYLKMQWANADSPHSKKSFALENELEDYFASRFFQQISAADISKVLSELKEACNLCYRLQSERLNKNVEEKMIQFGSTIRRSSELSSPVRSPNQLKVRKPRPKYRRRNSLIIPGLDVMPLTVNPIKVEDWEKYNLQEQGGLNMELSIKKDVVCLHCGIKSTPEWRKGPDGNRSLCNACGLFFSKLVKKYGFEKAAITLRERKEKNMILDRRV